MKMITERRHLRPFERGDLAAFVAYRSDPEVARYQSWDSSFSPPDAERFRDSQRGLRSPSPMPGCNWRSSTERLGRSMATARSARSPTSR
jgi:RimJ/RimL family protein N-acetyltransferase